MMVRWRSSPALIRIPRISIDTEVTEPMARTFPAFAVVPSGGTPVWPASRMLAAAPATAQHSRRRRG